MWCAVGVVVAVVDADHDGEVGVGRRRRDDDLRAPASRCFCAPSRFVKMPGRLEHDVDAEVAPRQRRRVALGEHLHPLAAGLDERRRQGATSPSKGPSTESYFSRCAIVAASPRSLTATISTSAPSFCCARKKLRPIRPKPLMPTRTAMCGLASPLVFGIVPRVYPGPCAASPVVREGLTGRTTVDARGGRRRERLRGLAPPSMALPVRQEVDGVWIRLPGSARPPPGSMRHAGYGVQALACDARPGGRAGGSSRPWSRAGRRARRARGPRAPGVAHGARPPRAAARADRRADRLARSARSRRSGRGGEALADEVRVVGVRHRGWPRRAGPRRAPAPRARRPCRLRPATER